MDKTQEKNYRRHYVPLSRSEGEDEVQLGTQKLSPLKRLRTRGALRRQVERKVEQSKKKTQVAKRDNRKGKPTDPVEVDVSDNEGQNPSKPGPVSEEPTPKRKKTQTLNVSGSTSFVKTDTTPNKMLKNFSP
ncbi:hypothetical protein HAX54_021698 [Datura stramonium]|uniref:Uncharacterized protein n=1 Tax=Datura stramonium TaxID=4076 RepID=A0ABS8UVJ7_DATST|nr:hypothetical protein [Datura stramonium]